MYGVCFIGMRHLSDWLILSLTQVLYQTHATIIRGSNAQEIICKFEMQNAQTDEIEHISLIRMVEDFVCQAKIAAVGQNA